jgi:hypothetical protein
MKKVLPLSALAALALAALAGQAQAQMPLGGRVGSRVERLQNQMSSKDPSVHYDPSVLKVGTPRNQVLASFDNPNASHQSEDGAVEDVYAFFPGGAKYADPQVTAGTLPRRFLPVGCRWRCVRRASSCNRISSPSIGSTTTRTKTSRASRWSRPLASPLRADRRPLHRRRAAPTRTVSRWTGRPKARERG